MPSERRKKRRKLVRGMRDAVERLKSGKSSPRAVVVGLLDALVFYLELREGLRE
jgi:hypothetical protein